MGMLDRIKKQEYAGFREFVMNLETTGLQKRQHIFTTGLLEDPLYMEWVLKNIKTFNDVLNLPSDEIIQVIQSQDSMGAMFAKAIYGMDESEVIELFSSSPIVLEKVRSELTYLTDVSDVDREKARYFILRIARKLQTEGRIEGFVWRLPPPEILSQPLFKDGRCKIHYETGVLAAEGDILKGKRSGYWIHNYDSGKLFAEGDYEGGHKTGAWVFYYGNGNLKAQGKYLSDLKQGLWKEWSRSGEMVEVEYREGAKV